MREGARHYHAGGGKIKRLHVIAEEMETALTHNLRLKTLICLLLALIALVAAVTPITAQTDPEPVTRQNAALLAQVERLPLSAAVRSLAWSPDGRYLAVGLVDGTVTLLPQTDTGDPLTFEAATSSVTRLLWSADGATVAALYLEDGLRVWDAASGEVIGEVASEAALYAADLHPTLSGVVAYAGDTNEIVQAQWDEGAGVAAPILNGHTDTVFDIIYTSDDATLVSASADGFVRLWESTTGTVLRADDVHRGAEVYALALAGDVAASIGADNTIWLHPTSTAGEPSSMVAGVPAQVIDFISADLLVAGTTEGDLLVYTVPRPDAPDVFRLTTLTGHEGAITALAASPDGSRIASGSFDGTLRLWGITGQVGTVYCDDTPPSQIQVGIPARVAPIDGTPLNMRVLPGSRVLRQINDNDTFDVIGGPTCQGGFTWWQIRLENGAQGWVAEGTLEDYFIEPLVDEPVAEPVVIPPPAGGTTIISGGVWHDTCDNAGSGLPPGCVSTPLGPRADRIQTANENVIAGVIVDLSAGTCPSSELLGQALTDSNGAYVFDNLAAGTYCISVNPNTAINAGVLAEGEWSFPESLIIGDPVAYFNLTVQTDEITRPRNLGWDYRFAP